jgi:uncharacterized membrane protein
MSFYLVLKAIHICAVVIFLGNIVTGLFWMGHAKQSRNLQIISFTMQGIIKSDKWFTIPGVLIIVIGGIGAAIKGGLPLLRTGWIFWSIVLFTISGLVFAWKVAPLQKAIHNLTKKALMKEDQNSFWQEFQRKYNAWEFWGAIAIITPLIALFMMVAKMPATTFFLK